MTVYDFIVNQALNGGRTKALAFAALRQAVLKVHDPVVEYRIGNRTLRLPLSHELPFFRAWHPTYSDNLRRLATFVRAEDGSLRMIDVGANVGDSFFLSDPQPDDRFLLVEGDERYFELLRQNTAREPNVTRVRELVSDHTHVSNVGVSAEQGTARVVESGAANARFVALDDLIDDHPELGSCNLLKTDVDGYDSKVLAGAARLLRSAAPTVFFEHYPEALDDAGEDDTYVFTVLDELGYRRLLFYDNVGFLLGVIAAADRRAITDALLYIRQRRGYYDVCAFHESRRESMERFLAEERSFYASAKLTSPLRRVSTVLGATA